MSKVERKQLLSREEKLKLHPVEAYFDEEYKNENEKKEIIKKIINQIKIIKEAENTLKCHNNKLGSYISKHCEKCSYHYWENGEKQSEKGKTNEWGPYLDRVAKMNYYCGKDCCLKDLSGNETNELNKLIEKREAVAHTTLMMEIEYKVSLDQKKNLLKNAQLEIMSHQKERSVLVFKKKSLTFIINTIQLSIIFVSTFITFFESIKQSFTMEPFVSTIIPIVCSTYIALILSIARFYKFDIKNERLGKVIERFSFIINKIRQKQRIYNKFDFKISTLEDWKNTMNVQEKDSIEDIIMKTNEERDLLMTLKEQVEYSKIFSKYRIKELIERNNFQRASELLANSDKFGGEYIYELNRLIKRKCGSVKYCCCFRREYVDYSFIEKVQDNVAQMRQMKKRINLMQSIENTKNIRYKEQILKNEKSKNNLARESNLILKIVDKEEKKENDEKV